MIAGTSIRPRYPYLQTIKHLLSNMMEIVGYNEPTSRRLDFAIEHSEIDC